MFAVLKLEFSVSERRQAEAARIREKYPDRIPVRIVVFSCYVPYTFFLCWLFVISCVGDSWEGWKEWHSRHWQEEVSTLFYLLFLEFVLSL